MVSYSCIAFFSGSTSEVIQLSNFMIPKLSARFVDVLDTLRFPVTLLTRKADLTCAMRIIFSGNMSTLVTSQRVCGRFWAFNPTFNKKKSCDRETRMAYSKYFKLNINS